MSLIRQKSIQNFRVGWVQEPRVFIIWPNEGYGTFCRLFNIDAQVNIKLLSWLFF